MKGYEHQTQYYETDQMGIIHHSNYIRWFESARIWYMDQIGVKYEKNTTYESALRTRCAERTGAMQLVCMCA